MSPAEHASPAVDAPPVALEKLLWDGEAVILAIKPSGWFVLLTSLPWLALAGAAALTAYFVGKALNLSIARTSIGLFFAAAACASLLWACVQWMGRLYVLTDRRVLLIRGIRRVEVSQCPLKAVAEVCALSRMGERILGLGSLWFRCKTDDAQEIAWLHVNEPDEVVGIVNEAIRRAR